MHLYIIVALLAFSFQCLSLSFSLVLFKGTKRKKEYYSRRWEICYLQIFLYYFSHSMTYNFYDLYEYAYSIRRTCDSFLCLSCIVFIVGGWCNVKTLFFLHFISEVPYVLIKTTLFLLHKIMITNNSLRRYFIRTKRVQIVLHILVVLWDAYGKFQVCCNC